MEIVGQRKKGDTSEVGNIQREQSRTKGGTGKKALPRVGLRGGVGKQISGGKA